ncbi:hypothetical protein L1987_79399 [Smallanthus sonchifolius]|uniref:Uncharacterized protein n=1 Tax=Smallanthus sonchifolius TaxID=185202 RepID=A0ACB8ZJT4_9ASTR|nr:hypothetical protein L1987_79399 [Smallanthus sonchifolius]
MLWIHSPLQLWAKSCFLISIQLTIKDLINNQIHSYIIIFLLLGIVTHIKPRLKILITRQRNKKNLDSIYEFLQIINSGFSQT